MCLSIDPQAKTDRMRRGTVHAWASSGVGAADPTTVLRTYMREGMHLPPSSPLFSRFRLGSPILIAVPLSGALLHAPHIGRWPAGEYDCG